MLCEKLEFFFLKTRVGSIHGLFGAEERCKVPVKDAVSAGGVRDDEAWASVQLMMAPSLWLRVARPLTG